MKTFIEKYLNSTAFIRDRDSDGRAEAAQTRAAIKVDVSPAGKKPDDNNENNDDNQNDDNNDSDGNDDNNNDQDDENEDDENNDNDNNDDNQETDEQKATRLAAEREAQKEQRKSDRQQKRIDKITAEREAIREENEKLKKQLAEKPIDGLTEEEVERRAADKAKKIAEERQTAEIQKQFEKDANSLFEASIKVDKDFEKKINATCAETAPIPSRMIAILADLDNKNGGAVLAYLANNVDDYDEIHTLGEGRMTAKLIRLSDKLKAAEKPAPRQRSGLPDPITPIGEGRNNRGNALPAKPTQNMDDFVRIRNQQEADKRKARGY
jgi:hypothetical protein